MKLFLPQISPLTLTSCALLSKVALFFRRSVFVLLLPSNQLPLRTHTKKQDQTSERQKTRLARDIYFYNGVTEIAVAFH